MPIEFRATADPSKAIVDRIADLTPENPFYTNEYICVRRKCGASPYAVELIDLSGRTVAGCIAFLTRGRLNSRVEVTSLPIVPDVTAFWAGLFDFCRRKSVSVLSANTFASSAAEIDRSRDFINHKRRSEFRMDLAVPDLWGMMNRRHHRLIKKAIAAGLSIRRSNDSDSQKSHVQLANLSLGRRQGRGDDIDVFIATADVKAFIECGAGEIFQAVHDGQVCSSILIARSRTGAYAQSSGTSDIGRSLGSSHFLFYEVACLLKSEGVSVFNLGGADENSVGLQEFKLGMGSKKIDLESAEFFTGGRLRKFASKAIYLVRGTG